MKRAVLLSGVVVLLSLLPACGRREGAPTLPQPGPERVHLAFRLVSAQTQNPVAGAKVLVRRAGRDRRAGEGEVLAEAASDGSGWVEVVFERRDAWDPIYLDIDGGPRYLHRYVWLDDTRYEPAPDVRTLWELNPEIGADVCVTYAMIFSCGAGGSNDPGWTCQDCREGRMRLPRGDVYVIVHPEFWSMGVWENFEEAARRMERALRGRWRWRVLRNVWTDDPDRAWPPEVPQDAFIVQVTLREDYPGCFSSSVGSDRWGNIALCRSHARLLGVILHEFGHQAGLSHLPRGVYGLMTFGYYTEDFTDFERWVIGAMRFRRAGLRAPDDQLQPTR
jgi:hypothetical protein